MPLVRAAATTAVVAGTAGAVRHHQEQRYANQAAEQQAAYESQAAEAQQAAYAAGQSAAAGAGGISAADMDRLEKLGQLHSDGVLSDEEFAAAKAKVLGVG